MSKIERYEAYGFTPPGPLCLSVGVRKARNGDMLKCSDLIPGTNITVGEWVDKGEEVIELLYAILGKATAMNTAETKRKVKGALVLPSMKLVKLTGEKV